MRDKKLWTLIGKEAERQEETLDLIASENIVSDEVLAALGTPLVNKYSEGYPGKRYYPGNAFCDEIERLAILRALRLFKLKPGEWEANVQPYSGSPANLALYAALMEPGETLMGMALASGGHLTHGHKVSLTGKFWRSVQYGVDRETGLIDYEVVRALALQERPGVIVSGFTAYPRAIDFKRFGDIAEEVGAYHVADISHIAGLVAAGIHQSPFPHAHAVMTTTHKTLRGPRGAVIFSRRAPAHRRPPEALREEGVLISDLVNKSVFPGLQGGPHNNATAAKALAFFEAMQPAFREHAKQVVKNARTLAGALMTYGFELVANGTDTHLILIDLRKAELDGAMAEKKLEKIGIIANRNTIPGDTSPFRPSGLRLGTPALTTRGMKEREMKEIARLIKETLTGAGVSDIKKSVRTLCKRFPIKRR